MIKFPQKKYEIIYADPPWQYRDRGISGAAEHHYQTMSFADLAALPVQNIAAKDSVLFLWATYPQLPAAIALIEAWGFQYKTIGFQWIKQNRKSPGYFLGCGHWTRGNSECCLLGVRGKPKRKDASVSQLIFACREEHSKKPAEVREKIVKLMGDLPRIELFARQKVAGWDGWGDEYPGCDAKNERW